MFFSPHTQAYTRLWFNQHMHRSTWRIKPESIGVNAKIDLLIFLLIFISFLYCKGRNWNSSSAFLNLNEYFLFSVDMNPEALFSLLDQNFSLKYTKSLALCSLKPWTVLLCIEFGFHLQTKINNFLGQNYKFWPVTFLPSLNHKPQLVIRGFFGIWQIWINRIENRYK